MKTLLALTGIFLLFVSGYLFISVRMGTTPLVNAEISDIKSILTFIAAIVSIAGASALEKMNFQLEAINSLKAASQPAEMPDGER